MFLPLQDCDSCLAVVVFPHLNQEVYTLFDGIVLDINEAETLSATQFFKCFFALSPVRTRNIVNLAVDFSVKSISRDILSHISVFTQRLGIAIIPVSTLEKDVLMVAVSPTMITIVSLLPLRH